MRWLGALSLERLVSATMRTPLACRLRVTISPWKSLPDLLERTDGSHVTSPCCVSSPRPPRPRWRSEGRRRSATHPQGRSAAEDAVGADFLASRGMGEAQGKKVAAPALRLRRSRRSRSSARSSHHRGPVRRVPEQQSGRRCRLIRSATQEVGTFRRRKRNRRQKWRTRRRSRQPAQRSATRRIAVCRTRSTPPRSKCSGKVATISRSSLTIRLQRADLRNLRDDEGRRDHPLRGRRRQLAED